MSNRTFTLQQAIFKLTDGQHLSREEAQLAMAQMMDGQATPAQIGCIITALRMKGETIDEITGFAETMRSKASRVTANEHNLLDTCGTGGDGKDTFNISTASAIIAAAGGIRVAKHGNRGASSKSGSADVLEALGVNIQLDSEQASKCLEQIGICFMFAVTHHQSMKYAAGPRKEIGIRTIFNFLGPLTNPAGADRQLLGVSDSNKLETLANVLKELGVKRALVVASADGLDEISISAPTHVAELRRGQIKTYDITPEQLGIRSYPLDEIVGGDARHNAEIIRRVFEGEQGAYREILLANAGACFYVTGHCPTIEEGVKLASDAIDSGEATRKLRQLIEFTTGEISNVS